VPNGIPCGLQGCKQFVQGAVRSFGTIFAHTFLMSRPSVKIFLTVSLSMFTCSAMLLTISRRFSRTACCWPSWSLFVSGTFSSPRKKVSPSCKLLFLSKHYPRKLALTSLSRSLMFVRCSNSSSNSSRQHTKTHADSNRCHSERDCHRSTTTQLWNADVIIKPYKAFVQCCHGKHTGASSRTLLSDHVDQTTVIIHITSTSHQTKGASFKILVPAFHSCVCLNSLKLSYTSHTFPASILL
jgi:hypothetical protein